MTVGEIMDKYGLSESTTYQDFGKLGIRFRVVLSVSVLNRL